MNHILKTIRAISAEFAGRIYKPVVTFVGAGLAAALFISIWLTTVSTWWLLLLIPITIITVIFTAFAVFVGIVINKIRPEQSKQIRNKVSEFVTELQQVAEVVQTPKLIILSRLAKDIILPNKNSYVSEITGHATSLKPNFTEIVNYFKN